MSKTKYVGKKALLIGILLITLLVTSTFLQSTVYAFGGNSNSAVSTSVDKAKPTIPTTSSPASQSFTSISGKDLSGQNQFVVNSGNTTEIVIGLPQDSINSYSVDGVSSRLFSIMSNFGAQIVNKISMGGEVVAIVVKVPIGVASSFDKEVKSSGLARYVEPNHKFSIDSVPNDPSWNLQWGPKKIKADYAWNTTAGAASVLVAVIDTGIDYNHPDLTANYVPLGYDWVNMDAFPMDDNNHGTFCAGEIAAKINNTIGIAGIAQVRIMAEKGLDASGSGWSDDLANCIVHATDAGANILSNSWVSTTSDSLIHDAVIYATNHGALVIAAAGNTGSNVQNYPGAYDEVVGVTATDSNDQLASFSNYGSWYDVAAPGVDIYSTIRVAAGSYGYMSGTSMACPHAAGVAALIWSKFNSTTSATAVTAAFVRAQLESTADDLGAPGRDIYYGNGRINAQNAVEQVPQPHDLLIQNFQLPPYAKSGAVTSFVVMVQNRGLSNETGVQVQLLANGTLATSSSIASILSFNSASVTLTWTPTSVGKYNMTAYVLPVPGETSTQNNRASGNMTVVPPPNIANWILLGQDKDEGSGTNLKTLYGQSSSGILYFKIVHYRQWIVASTDIDTAVFMDADQNASTGLPDFVYPGQNNLMGADYVIVAGYEGFVMWKWDNSLGWWNLTGIPLAYLDAPDYSNVLVVGVYLSDVQTTGAIDISVGEIPSNWDWMPDTGHCTFYAVQNQHDIAVTLGETPAALEPSDTALLSGTATNIGLNSEVNVAFQLLVNGTVVSSVTITNMPPMSTCRIEYMWTPTVEGIYIVNASATPVPGETATANNVRTAIVHVRSITVALISDNQELHLSAVPSILDSMNIGYTIYDYNNVILFTEHADVMLRYQTVIFDNDDRNTTAAEHSALQAFLAGGGNLLVTGYDSLGHPNDPYLADIVCSSLTGDNTGEPDLYVRSATHPIMNGPYGTFAAGYHITGLYSDCDSAEADTSRGAVTVAELADGRDKIIATQCYPGRVVYWNGAGEMDWSGNANCQAMFKNLMVWFSTAAAATSVYLVVRGLTNAINYTVCDTTTHTLGAWASLPGATSETPAAAKIGNELHVVVKGSSSNSLYHGYVNLNNGTFSGWSLLSENSNTMPTLTTNGTLLFLVIRTPTNVIEYSSYSIATRTWSAWTVLPGSTPTSPGATAVGNQLYVVVKGSSSNMLYQGYANTNNATFVGWTILTENSTSMPTMTNNGSKVFLVIQNQSNVIKYSSYSIATRTWSAWTVLPGSTPVCPGATAVNNQLYLIVKGSSSNMLYQGYVNLSTDAFSGWSTTTGLSPSGPTLTS